MKIYEVIGEFSSQSHVVIANNKDEAVDITVNYLIKYPTSHLYYPEDFSVNVIDANKFSEPTIIA